MHCIYMYHSKNVEAISTMQVKWQKYHDSQCNAASLCIGYNGYPNVFSILKSLFYALMKAAQCLLNHDMMELTKIMIMIYIMTSGAPITLGHAFIASNITKSPTNKKRTLEIHYARSECHNWQLLSSHIQFNQALPGIFFFCMRPTNKRRRYIIP